MEERVCVYREGGYGSEKWERWVREGKVGEGLGEKVNVRDVDEWED